MYLIYKGIQEKNILKNMFEIDLNCFGAGVRGEHVRPGEWHGHNYQSLPQILGPQVQAEESRAERADQQ